MSKKLLPEFFCKDVEYNLQINKYKGNWKKCSKEYLTYRLLQEVWELLEACYLNEKKDIAYESADVSAIAMMISDNFGERRNI